MVDVDDEIEDCEDDFIEDVDNDNGTEEWKIVCTCSFVAVFS